MALNFFEQKALHRSFVAEWSTGAILRGANVCGSKTIDNLFLLE